MRIQIEYGEWQGTLSIPSGLNKVFKEIGFREKRKLGEICFIFVSEMEIIRINREFLKHDYATDVITFSNNMKLSAGGDIFVCPKIVFDNAVTYESDNYTELFRVMIHGLLHLVGYNDFTPEERGEMRNKEDFFLEYGRAHKFLNF